MLCVALLLLASPGLERAPSPAPAGARSSSLASSSAGLVLSWFEPDPGASKRFRLRASTYEDGRWSTPQTIAANADLFVNWADFPSVIAGGGGLLTHWPQKSGAATYAYDIHLARRSQPGLQWRALGKLNDDDTETEHGFVSMVRDGAAIRAFWLDGREMAKTPAGPMTLRTAEIGDAIAKGEVLDDRVCECCGTDAAVTSNGPVVVYRDRSAQEIRDVHIVRRVRGAWTKPAAVHADGWKIAGCPVNGPAVAAVERDVVVAWFTGDGLEGKVRASFSTDAGETFSAPTDLSAAALGRVDVRLQGGEAIVTWVETSTGARAQIKAARVTDGGAGRPVILAETSASRASGFPRLVAHRGALYLTWTLPGPPSQVRFGEVVRTRLPAPARRRRAPSATKPAPPDYRVRTLAGTKAALDGLRGKPVLLNLWATWCAPCRQEVPMLAALHQRYAGEGLQIIGVSVDPRADDDAVRAFVRVQRIPYAIWRDPANLAAAAFGGAGLPATFLIDADGIVVWRARGIFAADDPKFRHALESVLGPTGSR